MYKQHFGLKDKPFNLIPDPDYLYLSKKHKTGLSLLEYGLMETAAGLTVAIPALIGYRFYRNRVDTLVVDMEKEAIKLVEALHRRQARGDQEE